MASCKKNIGFFNGCLEGRERVIERFQAKSVQSLRGATNMLGEIVEKGEDLSRISSGNTAKVPPFVGKCLISMLQSFAC
jgi:hypothetical protein